MHIIKFTIPNVHHKPINNYVAFMIHVGLMIKTLDYYIMKQTKNVKEFSKLQ